MITSENINYNLYTHLPCKTLMKADSANSVVEVRTPHKGVVFIELKEVDKGMFRSATEINRKTKSVLTDIYRLEEEAKNYLLGKWVEGSI